MHIFQKRSFEGEGVGTGAPGSPPAPGSLPPQPGAPPQPPGQPTQVAVPWGNDPAAQWNIGDKPWYEHLPDGPSRTLMRDKKYANPVQAADALYSANRMVNGNAIEIPADAADTKAWNAFCAKTRGETIKAAADYKFDMGTAPDGKPVIGDPNMVAFGQEVAFELGLSPKRAQGMVDRWNKFVGAQNNALMEQMRTANDAEVNSLRQKWGDSFDTEIGKGRRVVAALGLPQETLNKIEANIGGAAILDLFARLGSKSQEGGMTGPGAGGNPNDVSQMVPEQAQREIDKLNSDKDFQAKYSNKNHSEHAWAVDRMQKLYARI